VTARLGRARIPLTMKSIATPSAIGAFALCLCLAGCGGSGGIPRIGVALSSVDDSYIAGSRVALEAEAAGKARLSVLDGQGEQSVQNKQLDAMFADKAKAVIVNPIEISVIQPMIFKAKAAGVPIVFFSRDPEPYAVRSWDKAYFVGVRSEEAEALQVEILAEYWKAHPEADKNRDGRMQYVLVRGGVNHEAALVSAENRQRAFESAGIVSVKLTETNSNGMRADAQKKVSELLPLIGADRIEAVICENDEMALGAIEAMRVAGLLKAKGASIPVVGVDGTRFALDAIAEGSLCGTVRADAARQGKTAFDLAYLLAKGLDPVAEGWALTEGKYALVPYQKVTRENYMSFR